MFPRLVSKRLEFGERKGQEALGLCSQFASKGGLNSCVIDVMHEISKQKNEVDAD
jgi:hypothetical protein